MSEPLPAIDEPRKLFLRRVDVLTWMGISRYQLDKLVRCGIIKGRRLSPGGKLFFPKEQVRAVIARLQQED